jgi:hypothetical protein
MTAKYKVHVKTIFVVEAENDLEALQFVRDNAITADIDSEDLPWYADNVLFQVGRFEDNE